MLKSSQKLIAKLTAVSCIAWLDPLCHFEPCNRSRFSSEDEKRALAAHEGKRLGHITRARIVNYDAIADELPVESGLCGNPLLLIADHPSQGLEPNISRSCVAGSSTRSRVRVETLCRVQNFVEACPLAAKTTNSSASKR
jgi:hypothetical protein